MKAMKKLSLILAFLLIVLTLGGCKKEEKPKKIQILNDSDFRLHVDRNVVYMRLDGWLNPDCLADNETLKKTTPHNIVLKNTDESKEDKKYKMEVREYTYTSVTLTNIDYEKYDRDPDDYWANLIITTNPYYVTDRNIRVGDTRAMVKEAYGAARYKENDESVGLVNWTYKLGDYKLTFSFSGKYIEQISLSNLPENIYEYTEGSGEQVITVDENGNIISGNSEYQVIVESDGNIVSSQPESGDSSDTPSNTVTDSSDGGTLIQVESNGEYEIIVDG